MSDGAREAPRAGATMFLLRLALLAALIAATMALMSPRRGDATASQMASGASCDPDLILLPPGHPPIFGRRARPDGRPALPPGHPSIDGPAAPFAHRAPPILPSFEPPGTIDI